MPNYPDAIIRNPRFKFGESPSVRDFIAPDSTTGFDIPTGVKVVDAAMSAASTTLTSASANFSATSVGKLMVVRGAGASGAYLQTSIATFVNATTVTLVDAAAVAVTAAMAAFGPDSLDAFIDAVASGYALVPRGVYLVSGTIAFDERLHISGRTRGSYRIDNNGNLDSPCNGIGVEIWSTSALPVFEFLSDLLDLAYDINCSLTFENLAIYAKKSIKLNQERTALPAGKFQGRLLHVAFSNVELHGEYQALMDPNWDTAVEPTWDEMLAYGCGIEAHQCFGLTTDEYCIIQHTGIGIYLRDSDECVVFESRITQNGHNVAVRGTITAGYGNINKIMGCALGANHRVGTIRQEGTLTTIIWGNYFETYTDACRFLWSENNISLRFIANRVDNPNYPPFAGHTVTTPIVKVDDWHSVLFSQNVVNPNGYPVPSMDFLYTYWDGAFKVNQYLVDESNNRYWPTPGTFHPADGSVCPVIGGVLNKPRDLYRFAADNLPCDFLAGSLTFPFEGNAITGRWATIKRSVSSELVFNFDLQSQEYRRYAFRFTLLNAVGGAVGSTGGVQIYYVGAATTLIGSFALNPASTTAVEIKQVGVTIPPGEITNGQFEVHLETQTVNWEEILLIPIDEQNGIVINYGDTASYDPITGMTLDASASANQPNVPLFELSDVDRPSGAERGTIRGRLLSDLLSMWYMGWDAALGAAGGLFITALKSGVGSRVVALLGLPILLNQTTDDGIHGIQATGDCKFTGDFEVTDKVTAGNLKVLGAAAGIVKFDASGDISSGQVDLTSAAEVTNALGVVNGGTGAITAAGARGSLDVYSKSDVDGMVAAIYLAMATAGAQTGSSAGHTHTQT